VILQVANDERPDLGLNLSLSLSRGLFAKLWVGDNELMQPAYEVYGALCFLSQRLALPVESVPTGNA